MTPLPFVTRSVTSASVGFGLTVSRFGPTVPVDPASASVWQPVQPAAPVNTALPATGSPFSAGVVDVVVVGVVVEIVPSTVDGVGVTSSAPPQPATASPRPKATTRAASAKVVRRIGAILHALRTGEPANRRCSDGCEAAPQAFELEGEEELCDAPGKRDDPADDEEDAEQAVHPLPAGRRERDHHELVDPDHERDYAEQVRDRSDRGVVPLEDDKREDEPGDSRDQEEPPAIGGLLEDLAFVEHRLHRSSLVDLPETTGVARPFDRGVRFPARGLPAHGT